MRVACFRVCISHVTLSHVVCIKVVTDIVEKIPKEKRKDTEYIETIIDVMLSQKTIASAHYHRAALCDM